MTIIVRSMYNFVNCLQFNIRYEKVELPAPVGGALVFLSNIFGNKMSQTWTKQLGNEGIQVLNRRFPLFSPLLTGLVPRGSATLKPPPAPQYESSEESEDEVMCFGLFGDDCYGRAFQKKFLIFF